MVVSLILPLDRVSLVLNTTLPSLLKNLTVIKILIIVVNLKVKGKKVEGLNMIVHMSDRNENLCIPIPLTICLYLVVGNDLLDKYVRLSIYLICSTFISYHTSS
jgi:hypothetical protein